MNPKEDDIVSKRISSSIIEEVKEGEGFEHHSS